MNFIYYDKQSIRERDTYFMIALPINLQQRLTYFKIKVQIKFCIVITTIPHFLCVCIFFKQAQQLMIQNKGQLEVYSCSFELSLQEAEVTIKFPCSYAAQVKSMNNKITLANSKSKVSAINSIISFNQVLKFETELLYQINSKQFIKKDVLLLINLISDRRPDQQKLVGRLAIDLSEATKNSSNYVQPNTYKLQYCSVNAKVKFAIKLMGKKLSKTTPDHFDKDSFSDFQSFVAGMNKDHSSYRQSQPDKTLQIGWRVKQKQAVINRKIQESINEDKDSIGPRSNPRISHKMILKNQEGFNNQKSEKKFSEQKLLLQQQLSSKDKNRQILLSISSPKNVLQDGEKYFQNVGSPKHVQEKYFGDSIGNRSDLFADGKKQSSIVSYSNQNQVSNQNQYEQILKTSHNQQRKIWQQQKRLLNQQISREKQQSSKHRQRNQLLQKKIYETELKLCNVEGRIQNSKRQMIILQREKDLQLKELKSKVQSMLRQKSDMAKMVEQKQRIITQMKEKGRKEDNKKLMEQFESQNRLLKEKIDGIERKHQISQMKTKQMERENQELLKIISEYELKVNSFQYQITLLKGKVQNTTMLEDELKNLTNEKKAIQQSKKAEIDNLNKENELKDQKYKEQLRSKQQQLRSMRIEYEQKLAEGQLERKQLNEKLIQLQGQLELGDVKLNDLNVQLQLKDKNIENIEYQYNEKLEKLTQEYTLRLIEVQQRDQEQFNQLISQNQSQIQNLNTKIAQLQNSKAELQFRIEELMKISKQKEEHINLLQFNSQSNQLKEDESINQLQNKLGYALSALREKEEESEQMLKQIERLQSIIEDLKNYERSLEEQIQSLQEKQNQMAKAEEQNSNTIMQRNREIQKLLEENNNKKQKILKMETNIQRLSDTIKEYEQKSKNMNLRQEKIKILTSQLKDSNQQMQKIKLANLQLKQQRLKQQSEISKLRGQNDLNKRFKIQRSDTRPNNRLSNEDKLKARIAELEKNMQYSKDLENKVKLFQAQIEASYGLINKNQQLQKTIAQLNDYKNGLEEQILVYYNQLQDYKFNNSEQIWKQKLGQKDKIIKQLKQYQEGLELKILQDHEEKVVDSGLKRSIQVLSQNLEFQKLYQQGLEQKILQDYEKLQKIDNKGKHRNEYTQIIHKLQAKIAQLEKKSSSYSATHRDSLVVELKEKLIEKQRNIQILKSQIERLLEEKQHQTPVFDGKIRVIQVHSEHSNIGQSISELKVQTQMRKSSISKSMISQPPTLKNEQQDDDLSNDLKKNSEKGFDDMVMNLDQFDIKKSSRYPETGKKGRQNKEKKDDNLILQPKLKQQSESIKALEKDKSKLELELNQKRKENTKMEKEIKQLEASLQIQKDLNIKYENYIQEMQKNQSGYENKIKMLKIKQHRIQQTLAIIEQQSQKIADECQLKQKQCQMLKKQVARQNQYLRELQQIANYEGVNPGPNISAELFKLEEIIQQKQQIIQSLQQRQAYIRDKQLKSALQIQKINERIGQQMRNYLQLSTRMKQVEEERARLEKACEAERKKSKDLEKQVKSLNDQLMTNKRLMGRLRQAKQKDGKGLTNSYEYQWVLQQNKSLNKRIEELQQQLFSHEANQNEKDIQIENLTNQIKILSEDIEVWKCEKLKQQRKQIQNKTMMQKKNEELQVAKIEVQKQKKKINQQLSQNERKTKSLQLALSSIQSSLNSQRLQSFNNKRQMNQQIDRLATQNEKLKVEIIKYQVEIQSLQKKCAAQEKKSRQYVSEIKMLQKTAEQLNGKIEKSEKRQELSRKLQYTEKLLQQKNRDIEKLKKEIGLKESQNVQELQNQLTFTCGQLQVVSKRYQQLETAFVECQRKLETAQITITEINYELQMCQQQNQFNQLRIQQSLGAKNDELQRAFNKKVEENQELTKKVSFLNDKISIAQNSNNKIEYTQSQRVKQLQQSIRNLEAQKKRMAQEIEEKQMQHMNKQLQMQFRLKEKQKSQKSQLAIVNISENQLKKSLNASYDISINDIVAASKILREILRQRSNLNLAERQIQVMIQKISVLQQQLFNTSAGTKEKALLLEKTRQMSMQFSKLKVSVMRSKLSNEERMKFLSSLKPFEASIKDVLRLSQIYSEILLTSDMTVENSSRG